MSNESPYSRYGRKLDVEDDGRRHELRSRDNLLSLAGVYLGEWRLWREILERNSITNPFDLSAAELALDAGALGFDYERLSPGLEPERVDLTSETGVTVDVLGCSSRFTGFAVLEIEDTAIDVFDIFVDDPTGSGRGTAVSITSADFYDPGGTPRRVGALLRASNEWWISIEMDADAFFLLWTHRTLFVDVSRSLVSGRAELLIPRIGSSA